MEVLLLALAICKPVLVPVFLPGFYAWMVMSLATCTSFLYPPG